LIRRLAALSRLGPALSGFYGEVPGRGAEVTWSYAAAGIGSATQDDAEVELADRLKEALGEARKVDMERRSTSVGPHRDEIVFSLGDRDIRTRASQGEQRAVAVGLRVAAYDLLRAQRRTAPVLVLDDVFSELDVERGAHLVTRLPEGQVFVSTAREEDVPVHGARWVVEESRVRREGTI